MSDVCLTQSQISVLDQDEALDFYGDKSRQILLERPGPPAMDETTAEQVARAAFDVQATRMC